MIEYIKGNIAELTPTTVTLETMGVGYILNISLNTYSSLQGKSDGHLYVHEDIREDAYTLFGFSSMKERELFRLLISVSGVGGQTARMIISAFTPSDLVGIISNEDARSLKSVKGIGPKAAQRIIIDLKDKVLKIGLDATSSTDKNTSGRMQLNENGKEALGALQTLGFSPAPSLKVVQKLLQTHPEASVELLIKEALKMM